MRFIVDGKPKDSSGMGGPTSASVAGVMEVVLYELYADNSLCLMSIWSIRSIMPETIAAVSEVLPSNPQTSSNIQHERVERDQTENTPRSYVTGARGARAGM